MLTHPGLCRRIQRQLDNTSVDIMDSLVDLPCPLYSLFVPSKACTYTIVHDHTFVRGSKRHSVLWMLCRTVIIYLPASYIHSFQLHTSRITWPSSTDGLSEESSLICDCATPRQEAAAFFKAILSEHIHAKLLAFKRLDGELDRWIDSRASSLLQHRFGMHFAYPFSTI